MLFIEWKTPLMPRFNFVENKKRKEMFAAVCICIKNPLLLLMSVSKYFEKESKWKSSRHISVHTNEQRHVILKCRKEGKSLDFTLNSTVNSRAECRQLLREVHLIFVFIFTEQIVKLWFQLIALNDSSNRIHSAEFVTSI